MDGTHGAIVPVQSYEVSDRLSETRARITKSAEAAEALNTRKAYGSQLRMFAAWFAARQLRASPDEIEIYPTNSDFPVYLPINPDHVALWLVERLEGRPDIPMSKGKPVKVSALSVAVAAIKALHAANGLTFDDAGTVMTETGPIPFKRFWKGLRQDNPAKKRQAAALRGKLLLKVLRTIPDTQHGWRDALIVSLLYTFARRRSEIIEIDFQSQGQGNSVLEIGEQVAKLTMLKSKTSQSEERSVSVSRQANPVLFDLLERWIVRANVKPGEPLLRAIDPGSRAISKRRLGVDGVSRAVRSVMQSYYKSIGKDDETATRLAKEFTSHSGRVGFVVTAKESGAADSDIASTTLHASMNMIARYGEQADQIKRGAHKLDGVGLRYGDAKTKPARKRRVRLFGQAKAA